MKKNLVIYYSKNGSNKVLAEKIAQSLNCDIEAIQPKLKLFLLLMLKKSIGIKNLKNNLGDYEQLILCGPIWMGRLISPLSGFVAKYNADIKSLRFVTCCGSTDKIKDDKYGYSLVFKQVETLLGDRCVSCDAFPVALVLPDDQKDDSNAIMKTRLSEENFTGEIQQRFDDFIRKVKEA
jgi:menaquinone-dependent protoporphyrinogen IX oxidase